MDASYRNRAAIVGVGETPISRNSGKSDLQLALEACWAAIDDAGIDPSEIDGIARYAMQNNGEHDIMRGLGIPDLHYMALLPTGGGDSNMLVQHAAMMVNAGAKAVLVYRSLNGRSGKRYGQPAATETNGATPKAAMVSPKAFVATPEKFGIPFHHYMHTYGVTNENFADYVVLARKYAATNPNAWFFGKPITKTDHQSSRWIAEPVIRLLDCCLEVDTGVAIVITSADRARDLKQPPVGITTSAASMIPMEGPPGEGAEAWEGKSCASQLWSGAGLAPADMDASMIYENFTPMLYYTLEAFGFCAPGEAKDFIADGNLELDGSLPTNTHGGHLGQGYHGHGVGHIMEGVRQIRGQSANQIPRPVNHVATISYRTASVLTRI